MTRVDGSSIIEGFEEIIPAAAKRAWARLIKQVFDVDPLVCPRCAGSMRISAFIGQPPVIDLLVPRTADREDPPPSRLVAGHDPLNNFLSPTSARLATTRPATP